MAKSDKGEGSKERLLVKHRTYADQSVSQDKVDSYYSYALQSVGTAFRSLTHRTKATTSTSDKPKSGHSASQKQV